MSYLRNAWYLTAWADELDARSLLARTIIERPLVLFRNSGGVPCALHDRCPHRFAPLSRGRCVDGTVRCGYHGLAFDGSGACVHNPHGPTPAAVRVPSFPVCERHQALWVWMGEPERADAGLIPDLSFIDRAAAAERVRGHLETRANYQLMTDNIMDLTHADYLHPASLGGGINTRAKSTVEETAHEIVIKWRADADTLPPAQNALLPRPGEPADFRNEVYWSPPGVMRQRLYFGPAGRLQEWCADSWTAHVMTPSTASATHYFYCHTNSLLHANPSLAPQIDAALRTAFKDEDSPMLEAQQGRLAGTPFWESNPVLLSIDKGAVLARRRLDKLIADESG
jgi:vanillate O-demethylase monooxygenase subunit